MKQNEKSVDACIEVADNIVINRTAEPTDTRSAEEMVSDMAKRYDKAPYIPDNTIVVLRCHPDDMLDGHHFDTEKFKINHRVMPDATVRLFGPLQLALYCLREGLSLTQERMKAQEHSPGYASFREKQMEEYWRDQQGLLHERPYEERYDDWSYIFGTTQRKFTDMEKRDILTLGLLMSTGIERGLFTSLGVPSYQQMKPYFDQLDILFQGNRPHEIAEQQKNIRAAAGRILSAKYPEIAPVMHERCGLPSGSPGNEAYALVNALGEVIDFSRNTTSKASFYNYLRWQTARKDLAPETGWTFCRYRSDDPSLFPPAGLTEQQMWEQLQKRATECGIEPMDSIPFTDAAYCLRNGRNPLHPDNAHNNLLKEQRYRLYSEPPSLHTEKEPKQEPEIHIETDTFVSPGKKLKM